MEENVDNTRILYYGYGSNLDYEDWTKWCNNRGEDPSGLKEIGPAWLDGYQLIFDYYSSSRKCGAANLIKDSSGKSANPGALFEIDDYTLDLLDRKEGTKILGCYQRETVTVYTPDGQLHEAITYIHHAKKDTFFEPSNEYESLIRNGLNRLDLPTGRLDLALKRSAEKCFDLVFVYGTLMRGKSRHSEMENGFEFVSKGIVKGDMYHIRDYPGIIPGEGVVHGELHRASDISDAIQLLDWIEGANNQNPLFNRVIQEINTEQGKYWAYVYHFAQEIDQFRKIENGKWV